MPAPTPELAQWQQRFDAAVRVAQTTQDPKVRNAANEQLRQLQMSKPTGTAPVAKGRSGVLSTPQAPAQASSFGGGITGPLSYIADVLRRANAHN